MPASAFDLYAQDYDRDFTFSPVGRLQRAQVHKIIRPYLHKDQEVLELNCGTGHDAITISPVVKSVLATDVSPGMIEELKKKNPPDNVSCAVLDCRNLQDLGNRNFDLVFSNFGGLNCLSSAELRRLSVAIQTLLRPGGYLIATIISRSCLWEKLLRLRKRSAEISPRKSKDAVTLKVEGLQVPTYYYDPEEFCDHFKGFRMIAKRPVGLFVPPSYMNRYFSSRPLLLRLLGRLDKVAGRFPFFSAYGDHFLVVLKKE